MVVMLVCQFVEILGGAEKQCASLSRALQAAGEDLVILTSRVPGYPSKDEAALKVIRFWTPAPPQLAGRYLPASLIWALQAFVWILRHRRNIRILHVHQLRINAYVAAVARKLLGIPSIMKLGTGGSLNDLRVISGRRYMIGKAGARFVARHTSQFVATTAQIRSDLEAFGVDARKIASIPNGVDLDLYSRDLGETQRRRAASLESGPVISYVGRLSAEKNLLPVLNAINIVKAPAGTKILLVGEGPLRGAIEQRIAEARPHLPDVELVGQVEDVAAVLQRSHFLFLVSSREGLSNALLEAAAAGVLPILTMTSGTTDVIPFPDYPLFVKGDGEEHIASVVQEAYSMSPEVWMSWSERLQRHIQQAFGIASVAERYSKLYRKLEKGSATPTEAHQQSYALKDSRSWKSASEKSMMKDDDARQHVPSKIADLR
jgi:glycosyltransferase involved in cell wall biosynthesis